MNKLVVFDLDGVLVDSKDLHYLALNHAISMVSQEYRISYEDHINTYNGNPTSVKLDILSKKYPQITQEEKNFISQKKQKETVRLLQSIPLDNDLVKIFQDIRSRGIKIAVASNSIRNTINIVLNQLGVYDLIDFIASNEDVQNPKPSPEIYNLCMLKLNAEKNATVIFEDSTIGRQAARQSGAKLVEVDSRKDITSEIIFSEVVSYFE
jgi:HAD superfamily hydrolase (TIGR01509 family)